MLLSFCYWRITILMVVLVAISSYGTKISVDPKTHHFVDENGNVKLFHGINSVIKEFPWYDPKLLDPVRQKSIVDMGFNTIRLGTMWAGVEPEPGQFNKTYVNILKEIVEKYKSDQIYFILDMHQDVLWETPGNCPYCPWQYWGVPYWIKEKLDLPLPGHEFPWPFHNQYQHWECGYFAEEISRGFGKFYDNVNGVVDDFARFWTFVASEFKDFDNVLGYELINEPFAGNIFDDLSEILPGVAGRKRLQPVYEKVAQAIRTVDTNSIIFYEPVTWALFAPYDYNPYFDPVVDFSLQHLTIFNAKSVLESICGPLSNISNSLEYNFKNDLAQQQKQHEMKSVDYPVLGPGFSQVPGGSEYQNRSVLSWHYYCQFLDGGKNAKSILTQIFCDMFWGPESFKTVDKRVEEIGGGSILTEFGACTPNITDLSSPDSVECSAVMQTADEHFQSWTYWDTATGTKFWNNDGTVVEDIAAVFSRPFPISTCGSPHRLYYDIVSKEFSYQFNITGKCENTPEEEENYLVTEIYMPPMIYTDNQFDIELSDCLSWEFSKQNANVVLIYFSKSTITSSSKEGEEEKLKKVENPVFVNIQLHITVQLSIK